MTRFIISVWVVISALSCQKPKIEKQLSGRWTMTELSCGFCEAPTLQKGEVIWNFDITNLKLKVENNSGEPTTYLSSGTYDFSLNEKASKITIDSWILDYRFELNELIISDRPEVDGPVFRLSRCVK